MSANCFVCVWSNLENFLKVSGRRLAYKVSGRSLEGPWKHFYTSFLPPNWNWNQLKPKNIPLYIWIISKFLWPYGDPKGELEYGPAQPSLWSKFPPTIFHFSPFFQFSPSRPFLIKGVLRAKNLFSESGVKWPHYYREVISDFWFGGSNTRLRSPEGGTQTKSGSDQKTYLAKVVRSGHITIGKWSRIFDSGGSKTRLPSPEGGRQTKSCSD